MTNKKKIPLKVIEVRSDNMKLIDSTLRRILRDRHNKELPERLWGNCASYDVRPYRVIYSFNGGEKDLFSWGYRISGDYEMFRNEFTKESWSTYTIGAQEINNHIILHGIRDGGGYFPFGVENIENRDIARRRLKEKALELAKEEVLDEAVEECSECFIFDAGDLNSDFEHRLKNHPFFRIFLAGN